MTKQLPSMHTDPPHEFGVMSTDGIVRMTFADEINARRCAKRGTAVRFIAGEWHRLESTEGTNP